MSIGYIYSLSDPTNSIVRYIGYTSNPKTRYRKHLQSSCLKYNTHKNNWIKSLLQDSLKPEMLIVDEVPKSELEYWERFYVALFKSWSHNLVNGTAGGDGGATITKNHPDYERIVKTLGRKGRISNRKGIKYSQEQKEKVTRVLIEQYRTGKRKPVSHSQETRTQMSLVQKQRYLEGGLNTAGEKNGMYGKTKFLIADGVPYKSTHECATKLGIHYKTVVYRIKSKNFNYQYTN